MQPDLVYAIMLRLDWYDRHMYRMVTAEMYQRYSTREMVLALGLMPTASSGYVDVYPDPEVPPVLRIGTPKDSGPHDVSIEVRRVRAPPVVSAVDEYAPVLSAHHLATRRLAQRLLPSRVRRELLARGVYSESILHHYLRYDDPDLFMAAVDIIPHSTVLLYNIGPRVLRHLISKNTGPFAAMFAQLHQDRCMHPNLSAWEESYMIIFENYAGDMDILVATIDYAFDCGFSIENIARLTRYIRGPPTWNPRAETLNFLHSVGMPHGTYDFSYMISSPYDELMKLYRDVGSPPISFTNTVCAPHPDIVRFCRDVGAEFTLEWGVVNAILLDSLELYSMTVAVHSPSSEDISGIFEHLMITASMSVIQQVVADHPTIATAVLSRVSRGVLAKCGIYGIDLCDDTIEQYDLHVSSRKFDPISWVCDLGTMPHGTKTFGEYVDAIADCCAQDAHLAYCRAYRGECRDPPGSTPYHPPVRYSRKVEYILTGYHMRDPQFDHVVFDVLAMFGLPDNLLGN